MGMVIHNKDLHILDTFGFLKTFKGFVNKLNSSFVNRTAIIMVSQNLSSMAIYPGNGTEPCLPASPKGGNRMAIPHMRDKATTEVWP